MKEHVLSFALKIKQKYTSKIIGTTEVFRHKFNFAHKPDFIVSVVTSLGVSQNLKPSNVLLKCQQLPNV